MRLVAQYAPLLRPYNPLVLRRDRVGHEHFRTPTWLPALGAISCAFLVGPWTGREPAQHRIAGALIAIGVVLWGVTVLANRATGQKPAELTRRSARGPVS